MAYAIVLWVFAGIRVNAQSANEPFQFRGYYITFMRMPTMGPQAWRETIDCIKEDRGNTLLLWMGGAFRSKKFPITWQYNKEHQNIRQDFVADLIDYAHSRGIKVLLAFTPFAYDGVNQYPIEHPELKGRQNNGSPANHWGIHSWGFNLCPSKPASQRFMHDYIREMVFEFYPAADGIMIESSDYAICYCSDCKGQYFEKEFEFVSAISKEIWAARSNATVLVYPHYFSGRKVPGFDVEAAKFPFDPRWTLFFTPHSAQIDPDLAARAPTSVWWDDTLTLGNPAQIRAGAKKARAAKIRGYVPSLEAFSFVMEHAEGGESHLLGKRLKPFSFDWIADGAMPFGELPIRINRLAYREFSRDPDLPEATFKNILQKELFGDQVSATAVEDAMALQESWFHERSWWSASPLVQPEFVKLKTKNWKPEKLDEYRRRLERIRSIAQRYRDSSNPGEREMARIAATVTKNWHGSESLLERVR